jgi:subtilisin
MAAPHVTGAIASLKELRPGASVNSELAALQQSGSPISDSRNGVTNSRIDVWKAIVYLHNH